MAKPGSKTETKLQIRRSFAASRETLYRAWTERRGLEKWMCRDVPSQRVNYLELDVRTGGRYVMEVTDADKGEQFVGRGTFRTVAPPDKLVFTWSWTRKQQDGKEAPLHDESLVTVEFREQGKSSEVILTHEFIKTAKERTETEAGWKGCFDALAAVVE